jgi:hypothetical protein
MRRHPRTVADAHTLPTERVRARLSAYVYGNILVLAAVATATPHSLETGHAAVVVVATTVTTFLAHVLASAVGASIQPEPQHRDLRVEAEELRDAVPILSSGSVPTVLLLLAAMTEADSRFLQLVAAGVIVLRLGGIGTLVSHLSGTPLGGRSRWLGLVVASVSTVIVVLKVWLLH